ncbi:hypothetical protein [Echinicola sp. 20G]|uniref:hypothetical protein n=1 Tax=Echinicola sp. 20G TaxID=2781961 RepID=UPI001910D0EE|nr:hypothetical protein [Echinicola sp. 20G]
MFFSGEIFLLIPEKVREIEISNLWNYLKANFDQVELKTEHDFLHSYVFKGIGSSLSLNFKKIDYIWYLAKNAGNNPKPILKLNLT